MTYLEQREAYASLEPVWDGARERSGLAPGLSNYIGQSSMAGFIVDSEQNDKGKRISRAPRRKLTAEETQRITDQVIAGVSYRNIADNMRVLPSTVRSVVKQLRAKGMFAGRDLRKGRRVR